MIGPTRDELIIYNDITRFAERVWSASVGIEGLSDDPRMISILLYNCLWSNHKGYTILWKSGLNLEANIVLRSAVESAICIAANEKLKLEFVSMLRSDAAATVAGQLKVLCPEHGPDFILEANSVLHGIKESLPAGKTPKRLNWKELAEGCEVPILYFFHRMLSSVSSHVTGLSLLRGATNERMDAGQREIAGLERRMHPMMMAGAMLQGARIHSIMIEAHSELKIAMALTDRFANLSMSWPDATEGG